MAQFQIIVNPVSGRGAGERSVPHIEARLSELGLEYALVRTERPWHAVELAKQAVVDGHRVVVAVGGDGTVNEVINGLMQARHAGLGTAVMGVVSVGRGNDFAFGVGIPKGVQAGCETLISGHQRKIDVGRVEGDLLPEGRYFGNGVGVGFDAVVGFESLKMKRLSGFPSYIVAALKTIFLYYKAPLVKIEYEGGSLSLPSLMVSVMNGRRMGGGFLMAPESKPDDRLFDVCVAGHASKPVIFSLIPRFMRGTQASHPAIQFLRTAWISVAAMDGVLPAHADGETICMQGKHLTMELLPAALEVICQKETT